jgi:hypothetical protein
VEIIVNAFEKAALEELEAQRMADEQRSARGREAWLRQQDEEWARQQRARAKYIRNEAPADIWGVSR